MNLVDIQLKNDVKKTFEENYLKMLFEKHKDLPKSDIIEFIHKAQQVGANPSLNQIFLIERNTNVNGAWRKVGSVVFSYNFIQAVANQTGQYQGYEIKTFIDEKFDVKKFESKKMLKSSCVVKRNGVFFYYDAWFDEYAQTKKDGSFTEAWASKPYMMLEKCALSGALRRAFPEALSGMYCQEELEATHYDEKEIETKLLDQKALDLSDKKEALQEKLNEDFDEKKQEIEKLKIALSELTENQTPLQKSKALKEICGVNKFDEINGKTIEEIKIYTEKANGILKENLLREKTKAMRGTSES